MAPGSSLFHPSPTLPCTSLKACTWQSPRKCALNKTRWSMLVVTGAETVHLRSKDQLTSGSGDPGLSPGSAIVLLCSGVTLSRSFFFFPPWDSVSPSRRIRQDNSEAYEAIKCPRMVWGGPFHIYLAHLMALIGDTISLLQVHLLSPRQAISEPWEPKVERVQLRARPIKPSHLCYLKPLSLRKPSAEASGRSKSLFI